MLIAGCKNTVIPNSVTSIGSYAFEDCSGLTSITIPNSVTSIGSGAFDGCSGLTSITIPEGVTSIGNYAFEYCSSLTSVTIPESVTSIGDYAFYGCSGLTSITIPNSLTNIGNYAFDHCSGLTSVTNMAAVPQAITSNTFSKYSGVTLHIPEGCKDAYAAANYWKDFTIVDDIPIIKVNAITLDKTVYSCAVGGVIQASVSSYLPTDATIQKVTWSVADPSIAFVDAKTGQFVGLQDGVTTITATAADGSGVTATAIVKVGEAAIVHVTSIDLSQSSYNLFVGGTATASVATILPADATDKSVTWSSNNPSIAAIDSKTGLITGMQEGATTITATANDGSGVTATATVNVSTPVTVNGIILNQLFGFSTPTRGAWTMVDTTLKGTGQSGVNQTIDENNVNQQFALYMYKGQIYLWSQSAQHFLDNNGQAVPICNASPVAWTEEEGNTFFFHFTDAAGKYINLGGSRQLIIDGWSLADDGNKMTLTPVEGFELAEVQAVIDDDIHPVLTFADGETYNGIGAACDTLLYTRNFKNTEWQELYVPFSIDYEEWKDDFDIAKIHNFIEYDDDENGEFDRTYLVVLKKNSGSTKANYPYLIRAKETGTKTLTLVNKALEPAENNSVNCSSTSNTYTFTGSYTPVTDMYANGYYALSGGALNRANSAGVVLGAQRWYMNITSRGGSYATRAQSIRILVDGEDATEGIESSSASLKGESPVAYDLMGRGVKGAVKGVSIVNGKKIIR